MKMNNLLRETKKGSVFGYAILVIVLLAIAGLFIINPFNHPDQLSLYGQPSLSNSFEVTPIDAKASVSAELVEKDGVTYELLCKGTMTEQIKKVETYECQQLAADKIYGVWKEYYIKGICTRYILINETICIKSGSVKVDDKIISKEGYFCGVGVCDEYRDSNGGGGDGNGDGICQAGETCVSFEEFVK